MRSLRFVVVFIVGMALLGMPASAQQRGGLADRFKQLDRNGDGKVSAEEFPGPLFKQIDKDRDGFVTLEDAMRFFRERRAAPPAPAEPAPKTTGAKRTTGSARVRVFLQRPLPKKVRMVFMRTSYIGGLLTRLLALARDVRRRFQGPGESKAGGRQSFKRRIMGCRGAAIPAGRARTHRGCEPFEVRAT